MEKRYRFRPSRRTMLAGLAASSALSAAAPRVAFAAVPSEPATALAFDGGDLLLAAAGIWRSEDGGATWSELSAGPSRSVTALATHPDRPGRILAAMEMGGVAASEDGGATWARRGAGLPEAAATALAADAHQPDALYVAVAGDGLWQSEDAGATWSFAIDRPWLDDAEHDVLALASVGSLSGMGGIWVYAGTAAGLVRVPDCFCRWQDVQAGNAMDALAAGEAPAPEKPLPSGEPVLSLALAPDVPEEILAATTSGIWKSTDAGVSWTRVSEAAARALAVDPADALHVVAASDGGILSSRDGGLTWAAPKAR